MINFPSIDQTVIAGAAREIDGATSEIVEGISSIVQGAYIPSNETPSLEDRATLIETEEVSSSSATVNTVAEGVLGPGDGAIPDLGSVLSSPIKASGKSTLIEPDDKTVAKITLSQQEKHLLHLFASKGKRCELSLIVVAFIELYQCLKNKHVPNKKSKAEQIKEETIKNILNIFNLGFRSFLALEDIPDNSYLNSECELVSSFAEGYLKHHELFDACKAFSVNFINEQTWMQILQEQVKKLRKIGAKGEEVQLIEFIIKVCNMELQGILSEYYSTEKDESIIDIKDRFTELERVLEFLMINVSTIDSKLVLIQLRDIKELHKNFLGLKKKKGEELVQKVKQWTSSVISAIRKSEIERIKAQCIITNIVKEYPKAKMSGIQQVNGKTALCRDKFTQNYQDKLALVYQDKLIKHLLFNLIIALHNIAYEISKEADFRSLMQECLRRGYGCLVFNEDFVEPEQAENIDSSYRHIILLVRNKAADLTKQLQKKLDPLILIDMDPSVKPEYSPMEFERFEQSEKLKPALVISRKVTAELEPFKEEIRIQLDAFFRTLDKKSLAAEREKWVAYFKKAIANEIFNFIGVAMFIAWHIQYWQHYGLDYFLTPGFFPEFKELIHFDSSDIIDKILSEEIEEGIVSPETLVPAVSSESSTSESERNLPYNPDFVLHAPPLVAKPEHRMRRDAAAASSSSSSLESDENVEIDDFIERIFERGQGIRNVTSELRSRGIHVINTRRRTVGTHSRQLLCMGMTPVTLSVHPGRSIGPRTARDLNRLVSQAASSSQVED